MLITCNVNDFKNYKSDYNFIITRRLLYKVGGAVHFPSLSPSEELFITTLEDKKTNDNWYDRYEKSFIKELNSDEFMSHIYMICELLDEGFDVTLMCYCKELSKCHRRLVAEKFRELGYSVEIN